MVFASKSLQHCVFEVDGNVLGHADNWKVLKRKSQSVIPICTLTHVLWAASFAYYHFKKPFLFIILTHLRQ